MLFIGNRTILEKLTTISSCNIRNKTTKFSGKNYMFKFLCQAKQGRIFSSHVTPKYCVKTNLQEKIWVDDNVKELQDFSQTQESHRKLKKN